MPENPRILGHPSVTPLIQVMATSMDFGPEPAGVSLSQQTELTVGGTAPIEVTIAMASGGTNGYSAKLWWITHLVHGGTSPSLVASTSGPTASGPITPPKPITTPVPTPVTSYAIEVDFDVPATPDPNTWSDTVVLSWPQGSATQELFIALTGSSAQFNATVSSSQPITLSPDGTATVAIEIRYNTVDPSPIDVTADLATYAPLPVIPDLTAIPTTATMSAEYLTTTSGAGGKTPAHPTTAAPANPEKVLVPFRSVTLKVPVSAGVLTAPGNNQEAAFSVSSPNLPTAWGVEPLRVAFDIPPLPVTFSLPQPTINFIAGQSVSTTLKVNIEGANTAVNIGPPSAVYTAQVTARGPGTGAAPLTISWPSWVLPAADGAIQLAGGETPFTITAPASAAGVATVSLPWSAYDGQRTGTYQFQVTVLPLTIAYGGNFSYAELSGNWRWALNSAGFSWFTGTTEWNGDPFNSDEYIVGAVLNVANAANQLLWVSNSGGTGGYWNNAGQWNGAHGWINTADPTTILNTWQQICFGSTQFLVNYGVIEGDGSGAEIPIRLNGLPPGADGQGLPTLLDLSCTVTDGEMNCSFS
ncbi:MAG: hypothetical protein ACRDTV_23280 [Mycobacterium sp.]